MRETSARRRGRQPSARAPRSRSAEVVELRLRLLDSTLAALDVLGAALLFSRGARKLPGQSLDLGHRVIRLLASLGQGLLGLLQARLRSLLALAVTLALFPLRLGGCWYPAEQLEAEPGRLLLVLEPAVLGCLAQVRPGGGRVERAIHAPQHRVGRCVAGDI